ncbi:MAG: hypothetical protein JNM24_18855 [Bdellovibrionaceae bacterium]|nr:hypothetical protein [Pseudobdellovibrionaceae bacterium]
MNLLLLPIHLITALSLVTTTSEAAPIEAGEYLAKTGAGTLVITSRKKGHYYKINAYGGNGHSCFVEGIVENNTSLQKGDGGQDDCTITFSVTTDRIEVSHNLKSACSNFCGARASFTQPYYKTNELCRSKIKNKNLKLFKTYYSKKTYDLAENALRKVYDACEPYMSIFEKMDMVNDLAVTYKNQKKKDACLDLMKPFNEIADMSETDIKSGFPPGDADNLLPIAKKLKFNRDLCRNLQ